MTLVPELVWYKLNSTTANDGSAATGGVAALIGSPSYVDAVLDKGVSCNGSSQAIQTTSNATSGTNVVTLAFRLKATWPVNNVAVLTELGSAFDASDNGWLAFADTRNTFGGGDVLQLFINGITGGALNYEATIPLPTAGVFHDYVIVFDNSTALGTVKCYVDGVAQTVTVRGNSKSGTGNFRADIINFMSRNASSVWLNGIIDDVRLFTGDRSADAAAIYADGIMGTISYVSTAGNTITLANTISTAPKIGTYAWYRSTSSGFTPGPGNILSGQTGLALVDTTATAGPEYFYKQVWTYDTQTLTSNELLATAPGTPNAPINFGTDVIGDIIMGPGSIPGATTWAASTDNGSHFGSPIAVAQTSTTLTLTAGTSYNIVTQASNTLGTSSNSTATAMVATNKVCVSGAIMFPKDLFSSAIIWSVDAWEISASVSPTAVRFSTDGINFTTVSTKAADPQIDASFGPELKYLFSDSATRAADGDISIIYQVVDSDGAFHSRNTSTVKANSGGGLNGTSINVSSDGGDTIDGKLRSIASGPDLHIDFDTAVLESVDNDLAGVNGAFPYLTSPNGYVTIKPANGVAAEISSTSNNNQFHTDSTRLLDLIVRVSLFNSLSGSTLFLDGVTVDANAISIDVPITVGGAYNGGSFSRNTIQQNIQNGQDQSLSINPVRRRLGEDFFRPAGILINARAEGQTTTTLSSGINDSVTTLSVADYPYSATSGFCVVIDAEVMEVTGVSGTTFTVTRAIGGTGGAHSTGADVHFIALDSPGNPSHPDGIQIASTGPLIFNGFSMSGKYRFMQGVSIGDDDPSHTHDMQVFTYGWQKPGGLTTGQFERNHTNELWYKWIWEGTAVYSTSKAYTGTNVWRVDCCAPDMPNGLPVISGGSDNDPTNNNYSRASGKPFIAFEMDTDGVTLRGMLAGGTTYSGFDSSKLSLTGTSATITGASVTGYRVSVTLSGTVAMGEAPVMVCGSAAITDGGSVASSLYNVPINNLSMQPGSPPPPSLTAGSLSAGIIGATIANLAISDASGGVLPYQFQLRKAPDVAGSSGSYANSGAAQLTQGWVVSGLTAATSFWFEVIITDSASNSTTSAEIKITTKAATSPPAQTTLNNSLSLEGLSLTL